MLRRFYVLRDKVGAGDAGGGDSGDKGKESAPDWRKEFDALKAENAELKARFDKMQPPKDDKSLKDKADDEAKDKDRKSVESKELESALRFSYESKDFLKSNGELLPPKVSDIFSIAEREKYDSPVEKDRSIKSGIIQEFFAIQDNLDLLTSGQKQLVEEYLKLTNNSKKERAQHVYSMAFEPALEMLKRTKKAKELERANRGEGIATDAEKAYKDKMARVSAQRFLNEKHQGEYK